MSLPLTFVSYAGEWKRDDIGWWYQHQDQSYVQAEQTADGNTAVCYVIDGNEDGLGEYYYFDEKGYLITDKTLKISTYSGVEEIRVNRDGARVGKDGNVEQIPLAVGQVKDELGKGLFKH